MKRPVVRNTLSLFTFKSSVTYPYNYSRSLGITVTTLRVTINKGVASYFDLQEPRNVTIISEPPNVTIISVLSEVK